MKEEIYAKKLPLISVIIPVYNVEEYLSRCLDSVIKQTYTNLEIIVVDDGATDNSGKICDEYREKDKRIKVIHKLNGGLSDARNVGLDTATGEYISFIDSDDWVSNDYIEYLYLLLVKNECDVSVCGFCRTKEKILKKKMETKKIEIYEKEVAVENLLYQKISTSAWGKLFRIKLWDDVRFEVGKIYEDVEPIYLIFQKSKRVVVTNQNKYFYFCRKGSIVNQKFSIRKMDYVENCRKVLENVKTNYPMFEKAAISRLMWAEIHVLMYMNKPEYYFNEYRMLKDDIKKYRRIVMKDKQNKFNVRMVAFLSFMGYKIMKIIFCILKIL